MTRRKGGWPFEDVKVARLLRALFGRVRPHVLRGMKRGIRGMLAPFRKPELAYLETHLTDHCNLSYRGCGHYCPLAPPRYAVLRQLNQPIETCKWCSYDFVPFPWSTSNRRPEEWDAAEYLRVRRPESANELCS